MTYGSFITIILTIHLISACASPATVNPPPTIAALTIVPEKIPTSETFRQSSSGGEPRSPGYWLIWNSCAEGNQSETARTNGGREAGWILMDDLLADPGILVGALPVETCQQGIHLLQAQNLSGIEMKNDSAYTLAAQLLAALLNMATGSEYCPASDQAVSQAQQLLVRAQFDGTGSYLGPPVLNQEVEAAGSLVEKLAQYNAGTLCVQE